MVVTDRSECLKNLSIFSETSIAMAIGSSKERIRTNELKYFFNRYLSSIFKLSNIIRGHLLYAAIHLFYHVIFPF